MDVISKKKTNIVSGSEIGEELDIDEELELEGYLEGLEDIADEIARDSETECEPMHKEVHEERQEDCKSNVKVKEEDTMPSQAESHETVNDELVQSIKRYIQDLVKVKNETIETIAANAGKNAEKNVNQSNNSNLGHSSTERNVLNKSNLDSSSTEDKFNSLRKSSLEVCSDGELISDESISNRSPGNKYEIIEGTEIISDNSEWENLESGECSSSEGVLHKLCEDDVEYLSDATTVTGEDKNQIKKSVQEYYKKSEECFLSFYNKIKNDVTEDTDSFKIKPQSYSDSSKRRMCKITCHADYNKAKLILREFKRKSSQYKKSHRQNDTGHIDKTIGNVVFMGIVSQFDGHMSQEVCSKVSEDLKSKLAKLKRNVRKYEKKVGLRKREHSKKNKTLSSEIGRINSDSIELNYRNTDERESKYNQDKSKKSPEKSVKNIHDNVHLSYKNTDRRKSRHSPDKAKKSPEKLTKNKNSESRHNQHSHSDRRDSSDAGVRHNNSNKEKAKVHGKANDKLNSSEKRTSKTLTILSYLEDCEQSVDNDQQINNKERKTETNVLKKQEGFEYREKKNSSLSDSNKQPGKQVDKKKIDPNYDNDELFITYSELIKAENKNCSDRRKEEKVKDAKDVSIFAMTLSSEYGKNSNVIPFLQDESDGYNTKVQSKESKQSHQVNLTRECDIKSNIHHESQCTSSEKTKYYQSQVSNTSVVSESHLLVRSVSTSPFRTSSRSRSNSQTGIIVEKERYLRRSRSRSNSLGRIITERGRSRRSRSRSPSVIIEKEKYLKSSKTTPYAYRRRGSSSHSRTRYYKRYRSPSPHYRKRYRSRSRTRRRKRSSDRSKKNRRKYRSSSGEERDDTPTRSFARTPTKTFGDEIRRKLKEENEKALALLKLTLASQNKGQVTSNELIPFTSSLEEQRKDVTYKQTGEAKEGTCGGTTTSKGKTTEYEDQVSSINLSLCKLSELECFHQTDSSNEKSETSSSSKTESSLCVQPQTARSLTPPRIPLPPLPPNEPQPAPPLPTAANDVTVVTTYTSYVPMPCPSQPPLNYMPPPPPSNDMYMPYMNPEMNQHHHHHNPYMYPPPPPPGYQMGNESVPPPMFHHQPPPPPHMMTHPQNSYGPPPPFPYMHNTYPVPMQPYQNAPYQAPYAPNFTCHQNIVTVSNEPLGKKTATQSGPILMEIGSDSDNSLHSPVLPQNPTIQEAIQFVKHKMLKNDIQKAISETKTGVDNDKNKRTEKTNEAILIEDDSKNPEENKHKSDDSLKPDSKINDDCRKINSIKLKPIKFLLQSKARPAVPLNNSDVFGNSDNDCENIPVPKSNQKVFSKEQASEQSSSTNAVVTTKVTIEKGPVIYTNTSRKTPVKNNGSNDKASENIPKTKGKPEGSETKSSQKITETKENVISVKTENSQLPEKRHEIDSDNKFDDSELNNHENKNKPKNSQNNDKITVCKQEGKQTLESNPSEEVPAASAEVQETNVKHELADVKIELAAEILINEKQTELQEPDNQVEAVERSKLVKKEKNTELEKSKADGKNKTKFLSSDKSSEMLVDVFETNENKTKTPTETGSKVHKSGIKNKVSSGNETKVLYKERDEKHSNKNFSKNNCTETHSDTATFSGRKEANEKVTCQLESVVVSSKKEASKKLKVKSVGDESNECSEYTGMSVEHALKEAQTCVSVSSDDKQHSEVNKKEEASDCTEHTYQNNEKSEPSEDTKTSAEKKAVFNFGVRHTNFNTSTKQMNELRNKVVTSLNQLPNEDSNVSNNTLDETKVLDMPFSERVCDKNELSANTKISAEQGISKLGIQDSHFSPKHIDQLTDDEVFTPASRLVNEENNVPKKTANDTRALDIPISRTVCDENELSEDKNRYPEKEDISGSGFQNSRNIQIVTEANICEESVKSTSKKSSKSKEALCYSPCELESTDDLLQNEDLVNPKTNTKRNLRSRYKKQSSPVESKKNNKLEDSKVNYIESKTSDDITHKSNNIVENCEAMDIPDQKEAIKQTPLNEMYTVVENQKKEVTDSSTEMENEAAARQFQQADIVRYRACPLSKKTSRELTMMFLNDSNNCGIKLKNLRINLGRVKILPSNNTDCTVPSTSQGSNRVDTISSAGPSQNKKESRRKTSDKNDGSLTQTVTSVDVNEISSNNPQNKRESKRKTGENICDGLLIQTATSVDVSEIPTDAPSENKRESRRKTSDKNDSSLIQTVTSVDVNEIASEAPSQNKRESRRKTGEKIDGSLLTQSMASVDVNEVPSDIPSQNKSESRRKTGEKIDGSLLTQSVDVNEVPSDIPSQNKSESRRKTGDQNDSSFLIQRVTSVDVNEISSDIPSQNKSESRRKTGDQNDSSFLIQRVTSVDVNEISSDILSQNKRESRRKTCDQNDDSDSLFTQTAANEDVNEIPSDAPSQNKSESRRKTGDQNDDSLSTQTAASVDVNEIPSEAPSQNKSESRRKTGDQNDDSLLTQTTTSVDVNEIPSDIPSQNKRESRRKTGDQNDGSLLTQTATSVDVNEIPSDAPSQNKSESRRKTSDQNDGSLLTQTPTSGDGNEISSDVSSHNKRESRRKTGDQNDGSLLTQPATSVDGNEISSDVSSQNKRESRRKTGDQNDGSLLTQAATSVDGNEISLDVSSQNKRESRRKTGDQNDGSLLTQTATSVDVNEISSDVSSQNKRESRRKTSDNLLAQMATSVDGNEISSDSSSQNKRESRRKIADQNDGLTRTTLSVEEECESNKPLIQLNKLPEIDSKLCGNHKKVLDILNTFKSNKITIKKSKRKEVVLKIMDRTIDIVPLSNCYTNIQTKLNPVPGQTKEVDTVVEEKWVNKNDSIMADKEERRSDSVASDEYQNMSLSCKKQRKKCFEHKEDSNDSSKLMKKTRIYSELRKEFNSETEDSLLGEFASNDSNASLICEQVSSNSLILKINRGKSKRGKKRKIKLSSLSDNHDVTGSNIDEDNASESTARSIYDEDKISFPKFIDNQDVSNNTPQSDENAYNAERTAELAVFDFKDESSCDTGLEDTYLLHKRRKSINKKKSKTKRKRKIATDDKSDDLVIEPKVLRSSKSKTSKLKEIETFSPCITSEEMSKTKTDISASVTDGMAAAISEDKRTITCESSLSKDNIENNSNLLSDENVKHIDNHRLWEKISQCLNVKRRNVTTQVRYKQFSLQGEVSVEDTDVVSSEIEVLSLSDVVSALTKLHESV